MLLSKFLENKTSAVVGGKQYDVETNYFLSGMKKPSVCTAVGKIHGQGCSISLEFSQSTEVEVTCVYSEGYSEGS